MKKQPATYVLASQPRGTLYIGVTAYLGQRITQHREHMFESFTKDYNVIRLVHFEFFESMMEAIKREKTLKKWDREWKIELIEAHNPFWEDLYINLF
jgi:putative endonuclease